MPLRTITVDVHEPDKIKDLLRKLPLNVNVVGTSTVNMADYVWHNGDRLFMWERKKHRELLGEIGGILDSQLLRYTDNYPDALVGIIQEGMITPTPDGLCQTWDKKWPKNRKSPTYATGKIVPTRYSAYMAYLFQRFCEGIYHINSEDEVDTARTIGSFVYNSFKDEHKGLNRNVVVKSDKRKPFETHLATFPGIGMKTAEKLVKEYGSPWDLYAMPYGVLEGMVGERIAMAIFEGIGKEIT